jgi:Fe-S cluster assembly scaffold protein SufB
MSEKDIVINRLPAQTWNHLKMNDSTLRGVQIQGVGSVSIEGPELKPSMAMEMCYESILTGGGQDLDQLAEDAEIPVRSFSSEAGVTAPLKLTFSYRKDASVMNRIGLTAWAGQTLDVVMDYTSEGAEGFAAAQTKFYVQKDARLRIVQILRTGDAFTLINDIGGVCEEQGHVELIQLVLSGKRIYQGSNIVLAGDESTMKSELGYAVSGDSLLDINAVVCHVGNNTESTMNVAGSLSDHAKKLFRGTIDFARGCAGSVGNEKEEVLLMDETVVNQTIPLILCEEEDVVGNHGATIGRAEEEVLFYLTSRGISEEEAYRMLKLAKLDAVCGKIWDDATRQAVSELLHGDSSL